MFRILLPLALLTTAPAGAAGQPAPAQVGRALLAEEFDPARAFAGEIKESSDDQMLLTAVASARDDYAPDYSLAIAYVCRPEGSRCTGGFIARLLRVVSAEEHQTSDSFRLIKEAARNGRKPAMRSALAAGRLAWLEADLAACTGGIEAFDAVRLADWRPDLFYLLQQQEDREILMHPAELRVGMKGTHSAAKWRGWRNGSGVPAAANKLLEVLEPCWKPGKSRPPWERG